MATTRPNRQHDDEGFLLIALVVAVFIIALLLTVAAPTVARSLERDKEVESEHRAQQYVRAIHNYYLKFNSYPTSLDQLLSQNKQHFLRQQYKDPLTGGDYRLIHFGEAKTQVKGFFGEPLDGTAQGSLGSLAGSASGIGTGAGGATGTPAAGGLGSSTAGSGTGGFSLSGSTFGGSASPGGSTAGSASPASGTSSGGSISATQFQGSKGMIVGVGSDAKGPGQVEWNGSANIEDWEFLYDHRTWLLRQRVSIFGGSVGQSGSGSLGTSGMGTGSGSTNQTGAGTSSGSSTFGPSSTFGGSSFGPSSGASAGPGSGLQTPNP